MVALRESVQLAREVDALGYARFWVTEHHADSHLAGCAPEVLVGQIAAVTKRLRVGAGAVLLTHYSPLKVAETFRALSALHPGRIDLGLGSSTGVQHVSVARCLGSNGEPQKPFEEKLVELSELLTGTMSDDTGERVHIVQGAEPDPEIWLVGTGPKSAACAAELGYGYCFGHFFGGGVDGADLIQLYRSKFKPSRFMQTPAAMAAVFVVCAATDADAIHLAAPYEFSLAAGKRPMQTAGFVDPPRAMDLMRRHFPDHLMHQVRKPLTVGCAERVRDELLDQAHRYDVDELLVMTVCHDLKDRVASYARLADLV